MVVTSMAGLGCDCCGKERKYPLQFTISLIFLNNRLESAWSPISRSNDCGKILQCNHLDTRLSLGKIEFVLGDISPTTKVEFHTL